MYVNIHCDIDPKTSTNIRTVTVTILKKILSRKKLSTSFLYLPFFRSCYLKHFHKFAKKISSFDDIFLQNKNCRVCRYWRKSTWLQLRISVVISVHTINGRSVLRKKTTKKKQHKIKTSRFWDDITAVWRREKNSPLKLSGRNYKASMSC